MPAMMALISGIPEPSTSLLTNRLYMKIKLDIGYLIETAIRMLTIIIAIEIRYLRL